MLSWPPDTVNLDPGFFGLADHVLGSATAPESDDARNWRVEFNHPTISERPTGFSRRDPRRPHSDAGLSVTLTPIAGVFISPSFAFTLDHDIGVSFVQRAPDQFWVIVVAASGDDDLAH